ncbi:MAG: DUF4870 domain-containing protein [Bacteroidales bacterium]|nr:DUF4870 domain-containing protein [Lentimicrobiaceae bacterium]MDD5695766.1 DUF4870 domain-containing protein [Bacteroidales bacterium]
MTEPTQLSSEERNWGMFCHLSALAGFIIPFGNIIGPLIIWLVKRDQYPFVNDQGKESLNFQISILIYIAVSAVLALLLIGFLLMAAVGLFCLIMVILASVKANEGVAYRYPLCIRFIN